MTSFFIMVSCRRILGHAEISRIYASSPAKGEEQAMMRRIAIVVDPALSPPYPDARPVVVEAELNDGRRLAARKGIPAGDFAGNPVATTEVLAKFDQLVEPVLGKEGTAKLSGLVLSIATCPDVRAMTALSRP
jgi:2-methylcitrate dehydratase PrpD